MTRAYHRWSVFSDCHFIQSMKNSQCPLVQICDIFYQITVSLRGREKSPLLVRVSLKSLHVGNFVLEIFPQFLFSQVHGFTHYCWNGKQQHSLFLKNLCILLLKIEQISAKNWSLVNCATNGVPESIYCNPQIQSLSLCQFPGWTSKHTVYACITQYWMPLCCLS